MVVEHHVQTVVTEGDTIMTSNTLESHNNHPIHHCQTLMSNSHLEITVIVTVQSGEEDSHGEQAEITVGVTLMRHVGPIEEVVVKGESAHDIDTKSTTDDHHVQHVETSEVVEEEHHEMIDSVTLSSDIESVEAREVTLEDIVTLLDLEATETHIDSNVCTSASEEKSINVKDNDQSEEIVEETQIETVDTQSVTDESTKRHGTIIGTIITDVVSVVQKSTHITVGQKALNVIKVGSHTTDGKKATAKQYHSQ